LEHLKESLDLAVRIGGPGEQFHTPMVRGAYGANLFRYGRLEEAIQQMSQVVDMDRLRKPGDRDFVITVESVVPIEVELGHYQQAAAFLQEAFALQVAPHSRQLDDVLMAQAKLLLVTGRANEAMAVLQGIAEEANLPGKLSYSWLNVSLARAEVELGRGHPSSAIDQAAIVRRKIVASGLGQYFKRWEAQAALLEGKGLLSSHRATEALALLERSVQLGNDVYDRGQSPELADSYVALASCMLELGRSNQAMKLLLRAKAIESTHRELGEQFTKPLLELEARLARRNGTAHSGQLVRR
jgi:tetratricopeptide (TPR) repeat protein